MKRLLSFFLVAVFTLTVTKVALADVIYVSSSQESQVTINYATRETVGSFSVSTTRNANLYSFYAVAQATLFDNTPISFSIATTSGEESTFVAVCTSSNDADLDGFYEITGTCSSGTLIAGHTYYLEVRTANPVGATANLKSDVSGTLFYGYISSGGDLPPELFSSEITSFTPSYGSTVSTTTVVKTVEYKNVIPATYETVEITLINIDTQEEYSTSTAALNGNNTWVSTSTMSQGTWFGTVKLRDRNGYDYPYEGFPPITSMEVRFVVLSSYYEASTTIVYTPEGIFTATTTVEEVDCNQSETTFGKVMCKLFVPSATSTIQFTYLLSEVARKPPFGYIGAMTNVFNSLATSTATTSTQVTVMTSITSGLSVLFTPIRLIFGVIIWAIFFLYIWKRFVHLQP